MVKRGTSRHKLNLAMNSILVRSGLYKLKNMPGHGGNHPTGMLALPNVLLTERYPVWSIRVCAVSELSPVRCQHNIKCIINNKIMIHCTFKITLTSKEIDSISKYRILELTRSIGWLRATFQKSQVQFPSTGVFFTFSGGDIDSQ